MKISENSFANENNRNSWFEIEGYYVNNYLNFDMVFHSHNRYEIMYVKKGLLYFSYVDIGVNVCNEKINEIAKLKTVRPGEFVFIDADIPHKIFCEDNCLVYNIEFGLKNNMKTINLSIKALMEEDKIFNKFVEAQSGVYKVFDDGKLLQIINILQNEIEKRNKANGDIYVDFLIAEFMLEMSRKYSYFDKSKSGYRYLKKAILYIQENYNKEINVNELAEMVGIHANYLRRLFLGSYGMAIVDYINVFRVERAKVILEHFNFKIDEVIKEVGFNNRQNFNKIFKKVTTITPKEYLEKLNENYKLNYFVGEEHNKLYKN